MIKYILPLLLLTNIVLSNNYKISGKVFNSTNNKPLIGANVIIENTSQGAATDVDGNFSIKNIAQKKCKIKVQYIGFKTYSEEVLIGDLGNETLNISMQPEVLELETYIVTASRRKERIEDMSTLNYNKMRDILRKLGLNKYFEHIQYINSLFGIKPPVMNEELHETLCVLFIEIQLVISEYKNLVQLCNSDRTIKIHILYGI